MRLNYLIFFKTCSSSSKPRERILLFNRNSVGSLGHKTGKKKIEIQLCFSRSKNKANLNVFGFRDQNLILTVKKLCHLS